MCRIVSEVNQNCGKVHRLARFETYPLITICYLLIAALLPCPVPGVTNVTRKLLTGPEIIVLILLMYF